MLNRNYNLKLDLQFRCNNSNMEFNQFDKNTSDFFIKINRSGKGIDLSKALVTLMVIKPNGNVDSQFLDVTENGVYANLKPSLKDIPGDYKCRAIVTTKDETVIPDQVFTYTVNEDKFLAAFNQSMASNEDYSLLTDILSRLSTVETDEEQRQINEADRILKEEARQVAENKRVEAELVREHNDADREKAEAIRESSEHDRQVAENTRNSNESKRIESENARVEAENKRVEAELVRNENYEFMTSDEERRRNEENKRIKDEKLRVEAEKARVNEENKRRTTEQARVLKENERNSKETERESNEVARKTNEEKRVQSEAARSDRYNVFISDAENTVNNFKAYTSTAKQEEETRKANEIARIDIENKRNSNEVQRIENENTRKANEFKRVETETARQVQFNSKICEFNSKAEEVNLAKETMIADTNKAIDEIKKDYESLTTKQQQDMEVIKARGKYDSLSQRFENLDKDLLKTKELATTTVTTESNFITVEETSNGYFEDVKLEGRTLVNEVDFVQNVNTVSINKVGTARIRVSYNRYYEIMYSKGLTNFSKDDVYTCAWRNVKVISGDIPASNTYVQLGYTNDNGVGYDRDIPRIRQGNNCYTFKPTGLNGSNGINIRPFRIDTPTSVTIEGEIIILKGDWIDKIDSVGVFEGIASVGDGVDEIVVSSCTSNLLKPLNEGTLANDSTPQVTISDDYSFTFNSTGWGQGLKVDVVNIKKGETYYIIADEVVNGVVKGENALVSGDVQFVGNKAEIVAKSTGKASIYLKNAIESGVIKFTNVRVVKKGCDEVFVPYQSDKKKVLYYDTETQTWKKPILREWDSIEEHNDGKYYYHKRSKERILESSLGWRLEGSGNSDDLISFMVGYYDDMLIGTNIICDKFNNSDIVDAELIRFINSNMQVIISKSKLETPNVEGFKKWLQANNVSVVYQLAKEKVYECTPIDLVTFEGETNYSINCGAISPKSTLKCVNYIGNVINTLKEKVSNLEDKLYNTNLANFTVALNTLDTKLKLEQLTKAPK